MKRILTVATVLILICSTAIAYVGNRNTRKFHHDSCSSVYQMKPSNRVYIETREEAINSGYVPCKRCRP
jgi:methylphosphotriester-DNA--protein-cysteine methyltransferase